MKDSVYLMLITAILAAPAALAQDGTAPQLPEPSTVALFASAALAILVAKKIRK